MVQTKGLKNTSNKIQLFACEEKTNGACSLLISFSFTVSLTIRYAIKHIQIVNMPIVLIIIGALIMVTEKCKLSLLMSSSKNNENKHPPNLTVGRRISFGFPSIIFIRKQKWKT